jgi:hypothetical protein
MCARQVWEIWAGEGAPSKPLTLVLTCLLYMQVIGLGGTPVLPSLPFPRGLPASLKIQPPRCAAGDGPAGCLRMQVTLAQCKFPRTLFLVVLRDLYIISTVAATRVGNPLSAFSLALRAGLMGCLATPQPAALLRHPH